MGREGSRGTAPAVCIPPGSLKGLRPRRFVYRRDRLKVCGPGGLYTAGFAAPAVCIPPGSLKGLRPRRFEQSRMKTDTGDLISGYRSALSYSEAVPLIFTRQSMPLDK
jgi:hypothetical protein